MWRKALLLGEILSSLWQALQIQSTGSRLETGWQAHSLCGLWRSSYLVCRDCNFDDLGRVASQSYVADPCDHPTLVDLPRLGLCLQPGISETQKDTNRFLKVWSGLLRVLIPQLPRCLWLVQEELPDQLERTNDRSTSSSSGNSS